ncbi:DUF551 domain-containing protein [Klebsiella pneumoniae]
MTKSAITRERLEWLSQISCRDDIEDIGGDEIRELASMALAAMDSEPVILYRQVNPANGMKTYWAELDQEEFRHLKKYTDENAEFMTLYRHAQQPVVESEPVAYISKSDLDAGYPHILARRDFNKACTMAVYAAQPAPQSPGIEPATVPGKWIPVSEKMPDDDDFVYIWPRPDFGVELHVGQYCECSPKGDGWYAQVYEQNYGIEWHPITVTHWMPLPAAPQEVKGE